MKRYLSSDLTWWTGMAPAFLLAAYFVIGWVERRNDPSTLLSAIGAIAAGVIITCMIAARTQGLTLVEKVTPKCDAIPEPEPQPQPEVDCEKTLQIPKINLNTPVAPVPAMQAMPKLIENPWFEKGVNLARAKQYRDALYCFSYVLQSDPANQAALTAKGECLMKMNRPEEALKAFMQAAQIDETNPLAQECKEAVIKKVRAATYF